MPPCIRITNHLAVSRITIRLCSLDPTIKSVVPSAETDIPGPGVGDGVAGVGGVDGWLTVMDGEMALASEPSLAVSVMLAATFCESLPVPLGSALIAVLSKPVWALTTKVSGFFSRSIPCTSNVTGVFSFVVWLVTVPRNGRSVAVLGTTVVVKFCTEGEPDPSVADRARFDEPGQADGAVICKTPFCV